MSLVPQTILKLKDLLLNTSFLKDEQKTITIEFNSQFRAKSEIDFEKMKQKIENDDLEGFRDNLESEIDRAIGCYLQNLLSLSELDKASSLRDILNYLTITLSNKQILNLFPGELIREDVDVMEEYKQQIQLFSKFKKFQKIYDIDLDEFIKLSIDGTIDKCYPSQEILI